jgi:hypothetical protein
MLFQKELLPAERIIIHKKREIGNNISETQVLFFGG